MHFLGTASLPCICLPSDRIAMRVRVLSPIHLVVDAGPHALVMLDEGTELYPLPEVVQVVDGTGARVPALGVFYVTRGTDDPDHLLTDLF